MEGKNPTCFNFQKDSQKLYRLTKQLCDEDNSRAKITLEENSKLLTGKQAADKYVDNYANSESNAIINASKERSKERDEGKNNQQNKHETHAAAPHTWWVAKSSQETETKAVAQTRWFNQGDAYPPWQCSSMQAPPDFQPQVGTSASSSTDLARSNYDLHFEKREGPKEGKQLLTI